ncbi:hypothetical protein RvY_16428-2 [Ramazzottius varieornatus]|nr:hypothetical protein RvY_16428-2 [Ramazzottius varieornatus]
MQGVTRHYRRGNTGKYRQPRATQSGESRTLNGSKIDEYACKAGNAVSLKFTVVPNFYLDKRYFASSNIPHRHVEEGLCDIWQRCIVSTMGVKWPSLSISSCCGAPGATCPTL